MRREAGRGGADRRARALPPRQGSIDVGSGRELLPDLREGRRRHARPESLTRDRPTIPFVLPYRARRTVIRRGVARAGGVVARKRFPLVGEDN